MLKKTDHETQQTTTYTYNEANQIANTDFDYDDNGNQTAEPGVSYEYDSQNRMTGATKGGVAYSFSYDGDGNRVSQAEDGSAIEYIVDRTGGLAQVVAEVTLDNTIEVFYVRGDDLISQWRKSNGSESVSYYGCDGHGSTVILTDSGGVATDHWFYDAWGNIFARDGSTVNVYRYTGQQQDGTDLYYLRARHYSPTLTRFLQRDPVEGSLTEPLTLHKYCYCVNNPVNRIDPSGLQPTMTGMLTAMAIGALLGGLSWHFLFPRGHPGRTPLSLMACVGVGALVGAMVYLAYFWIVLGIPPTVGAAQIWATSPSGQRVAQSCTERLAGRWTSLGNLARHYFPTTYQHEGQACAGHGEHFRDALSLSRFSLEQYARMAEVTVKHGSSFTMPGGETCHHLWLNAFGAPSKYSIVLTNVWDRIITCYPAGDKTLQSLMEKAVK